MEIIGRAFSVLEAVAAAPDGAALSEIAATTSLPLATCHRLLATLDRDHLVERTAASKRYRPGPALVRLSSMVAAAGTGPMVERALDDLRDQWQECFFLAELFGDTIMSVRAVTTTDANRMTVSVPLGQRMYPHASASGKVILAHTTAERRRELIDAAGGFVPLTGETITTEAELDAELQRVLDTGYAVCDQETEVGAAAFAVPIIRGDDDVDMSLGVIGPRDRIMQAEPYGMIGAMMVVATTIAALERQSHLIIAAA